MPRSYQRKTTIGGWSEKSLKAAVDLVLKKKLSMRKAADSFDIPFSTLQKRIKTKNFGPPSLGCTPIFTKEQEYDMAEHIKSLAKLFYGLTPLQLRQAAYDYAERNNIQHNFNKELKLAGIDWFYNFIRRNPSVTIRKPEATSISRITAFNKEEVTLFFDNLESLMEKYKFTATTIFNMDETGISTVQDPGNILAPKGQKRVGSITSWERGKNVTVICAISASGSYIPPVFIFPRKRMDSKLTRNGPPGALYECSKNGWTNDEIFLVWLKHFSDNCNSTAEKPVLLILDNHGSHITLAAFQYCRDNHIVMLSLPPHSSHRMQPLDVTFFGPLKAAYRRECDFFMKSKAMVKITPYDISDIFNRAYSNVASIQKGVSGFSATGIYPLNPNIFSDEDFYAANTFCQNDINQNNDIITVNQNIQNLTDSTQELQQSMASTSHQYPTTSNMSPSVIIPAVQGTPSSRNSSVTIEEISPVPKTLPSKVIRRKAAKQHSTIITASPMKDKLIDRERKRQMKKSKEESGKIKKKQILKKPTVSGKFLTLNNCIIINV